MNRFIALLFLFVLSAPTVHAESATYTLADLVVRAKRNAPLVAAQQSRVEEKRLSAIQARTWPGLSIDVAGGQRKQGEESGPRFEAAIRQLLPLLGKERLGGALLGLESELWQRRVSLSEAALTQQVIQLAYDYTTDKRKADFTQDRRKRFELLEAYMAGRVFASPQRKTEIRIVRNRLNNLKADAIQTAADKKAAFEALQVFVPLDAPGEPAIETPWLKGTSPLLAEPLLAKANERNADLLAQKSAVEASQIEQTLARRNRWPDPSLIVSYDQAKAADTEKNYGLGLGLALPAWNGNRAAIKSLEIRKTAEERLLAYQKQQVSAELARALNAYEAARQKVQTYSPKTIEELSAQLQETEAGFRKGQVDLLTFLELDGSAADLFAQVVDAQLALVSALNEIWRLSGEQNVLDQLGSY